MSKITTEDVRKVAHLARLELPEDEVDTYTTQLEQILGYFAHLEEVETEGVPETARAVEVVNVSREDQVERTTIREDLLNQAPHRQDDFFRVPKIMSI